VISYRRIFVAAPKLPSSLETNSTHTFFQQALLHWYADSDRPLPWKGEKDPYRIWLSEIILQQTRVEQGMPYYFRFLEAFPTIVDLANAPDDQVMKLWEGLGYYSRARNLLATARRVANDRKGVFPSEYAEILALPGIGPYTAAAIGSFAFGLPRAVVDGNVYRVLARFFGIATPQDSTEGKKQFQQLAESLLDQNQPGLYNQAIMDFGATFCVPRSPNCGDCPLRERCVAYAQEQVQELPVKTKKIQKKDRYFHYFLLYHQDQVFIRKRTERDIWQDLYEFPMIESPALPIDLALPAVQDWLQGTKVLQRQTSPLFKQILTHQQIIAQFWKLELAVPIPNPTADWQLIEHQSLKQYAFPMVIDLYLAQKNTSLTLF
jgi:A/G-specific adenine glycosylase